MSDFEATRVSPDGSTNKGKFVGKLLASEFATPRGFRIEVRGTIVPRDKP